MIGSVLGFRTSPAPASDLHRLKLEPQGLVLGLVVLGLVDMDIKLSAQGLGRYTCEFSRCLDCFYDIVR